MQVMPSFTIGTKDVAAFPQWDLWEDDTAAGETSSDDDGSHSSAHYDSMVAPRKCSPPVFEPAPMKAKSVFPWVDSLLEANPKLDDLDLLAKYEARIDRENGWDKRNLDTFGAAECDHDALVDTIFGEGNNSSAHWLPSRSQQRSHVSSLNASAAPWHPQQLVTQDQEFLDGYMAAMAGLR